MNALMIDKMLFVLLCENEITWKRRVWLDLRHIVRRSGLCSPQPMVEILVLCISFTDRKWYFLLTQP